MSITVDILWAGNDSGEVHQKKKFKDEISAIEWIRRNHANISAINGHYTFCEPVSHFTIMDCLKN